jgi:hypothetical protein
MTAGHRHFYFWCSNCATRVEIETAECKEDDSRDVSILPDVEIPCPMCEHMMWTWDEIAARDESFMNRGTWADFERWRAKQKEPPTKAHVLLAPEEHLWEIADIIAAGVRERLGGGTNEVHEMLELWCYEAEEHIRKQRESRGAS